MTKVILVRHGQTIWNAAHRYQGHSDIELNEAGREQARLVAERLQREPITAVYASDLVRAHDTAACIAAKHKLSVTTMPEFREISFGKWEGLTYNEIQAGWPQVIAELFERPDVVQIPDGETFLALQQRAMAGIRELTARHPDETIVVASHGGTLRTILTAALYMPLKHLWKFKQDNTAVNIISYYDDAAVVELVNDTHHVSQR